MNSDHDKMHLQFIVMNNLFKKYILLLVFSLTLLNFSSWAVAQEDALVSENFAPPLLDDGWQVADIDFAKLDQKAMEQLTRQINTGEFRRIQAVLVAHKERLVYEYYWTRPKHEIEESIKLGRQSPHQIRSITKSITSLILGVALKSDFEQAVQRPVLYYLPDQQTSDPKSKSISLENVLTMTAGLLWNEMDVPYTDSRNDSNQQEQSSDPINYLLARRPVRDEPGSRWYYNSGLTMLTAAVINSLIDKPFFDFAKEKLFDPLKIKNFAWSGQWPDSGLVSAAGGLRMNARDLLKIGSLVLNKGQWKGQQIVPSKWVELSTRRLREDLRTWGADGLYGYGYQWWHGRHEYAVQ